MPKIKTTNQWVKAELEAVLNNVTRSAQMTGLSEENAARVFSFCLWSVVKNISDADYLIYANKLIVHNAGGREDINTRLLYQLGVSQRQASHFIMWALNTHAIEIVVTHPILDCWKIGLGVL